MSSKIDGVPRELLERLTNMQPIERDDPNGSGCNLCPECFGDGKWNWKAGKVVSIDPIDHYEKCAIEELRAILAAPVVEHQPDYFQIKTPKVTVNGVATEWWPALLWYTKEELKTIGEYEVVGKLYRAPPELAELQATIVQQAQWIADLERVRDEHVAASAYLDKVKELNG